jgi:ornithine cyclodeaminase/alanine dehydrogenase-like protein (mu-crystallin family)
MPVTSRVLARTAAATSIATLYTVPNSSTVTVVTNIVIANAAATASTATISIDAVQVVPAISIAANSVFGFDLKQVIPANATPKIIEGFASSTSVTFHISGVEIV